MRARIVKAALTMLMLLVGIGIGAPSASAAPADPQLDLSSDSGADGDEITVELTGWTPGVLVSVAVCGNGPGSASCAMEVAAQVVPDEDGEASATLLVVVPPDACPCEVRALSVDGGASNAAFEVDGADVADPDADAGQAPPEGPAELSGAIRVAGESTWREQFALGGSRTVTVAVTNVSQVASEQGELDIVLGRNTRSGDVVLSFDVPSLPPGGSFETSGEFDIPAGATGKFTLYVVGPGSMNSIAATTLQTWAVLGAAAIAALVAFGWAIAGVRKPSERSRGARLLERLSLGLLLGVGVVGLLLLYVTLR